MAAAVAFPIRTPGWSLTYAGVGITSDVSPMVLAIRYTDRLGGASGDLEIDLDNSDGRWSGAWSPSLGDQINLMIGYAGEPLLPCGDFEIDELELSAPPAVAHLRCLAAFITPAMRTRRSAGYENLSMTGIAALVASRYGLTVVGGAETSAIEFERVTQKRETDLGFLRRIANECDHDFTVRGTQLVFYAREALEAQAPVMTIAPEDTIRFELTNRSHRTYRAARVSWFDPHTKALIEQSASDDAVRTGDTLEIVARCENGQQARLRAAAELDLHNLRATTARLTMPGATVLAAGSNALLAGFGVADGTYAIETAHHRLSAERGAAPGYTTEIEARRVD